MRTLLATVAAAILAAGVLGTAGPVSAVPPTPPPADAPSYYPSGPQYDVSVATLEDAGWVRCFQEPYSFDMSTSIAALLAACDGDYLILTGREIGTSTLEILAAAPRTDVFTTTVVNSPRLVNGSYWYFTPDVGDSEGDLVLGSMGFSTDEDIDQFSCDISDGASLGGLCWHMATIDGGELKLEDGYSLNGINLNAPSSEGEGIGDQYYREAYMYSFDGVTKGNFTISAGEYHTCAIAFEGEALCWGENGDGQLGDGTTSNSEVDGPRLVIGGHEWASISAGNDTSCGITTSGAAYCWGENEYGQLGDGTTDDSDEAGPQLVIGGRTWKMISVGEDHVCGITTSGSAYCWGYNDDGQLGNGTDSDTLESGPSLVSGDINWSSISAGVQHTCGLSTSGTAYCWGSELDFVCYPVDFDPYYICEELNSGQLGNGPDEGATEVPTAVDGALSFASIDAGDFHTCAVTESGDGYCWGSGSEGQVGNGADDPENQSPVLVSGGLDWSYIDPGDDHTCGVTMGGAAYCWGDNEEGELGNGDYESTENVPQEVIGGYTFNQIISNGFEGGNHSCGIAMNYIAYCWGNNDDGQLGDGTGDDSEDLGPRVVLGGSKWKFLAYGESGVDPNCGTLDLTVCPTITAGARGLIGAPGTSHVANRVTYTWLRCTVPGAAVEGPRAPATCRTIRSTRSTAAQMAVRPYLVTSRDVKAGYIRLAVKVGTRTYYSGAYSVAP